MTHLLQREDPLRYTLLLPPGAHAWLASIPPSGRWHTQIVHAVHYSLTEQMEMPRLLHRIQTDLLFSPHFTVPWRCPVPFVVTIHDLILHRFPNAAPFWKRTAYRLLLHRTLRRARAIITVSDFVRGELASLEGVHADRITVVPEGVSQNFRRRSQQEQDRACALHGIDRPFFLYVGNAKQHKNIPLLLRSWEQLDDPHAQLVLVTSGKEAERLVLPPGALRLPDVEDDDLAALYCAARAFVTPSLYEGYCLPLVEALSCTCPVVALRTGPLQEVSQGQALLVEPTLEAFTAALRSPPPPPMSFHPPSWGMAAEQTARVLLSALTPRS